MGFQEVLVAFLDEQEPAVRRALGDIIVAQQKRIDMKSPQGIMEAIDKALDSAVRMEDGT